MADPLDWETSDDVRAMLVQATRAIAGGPWSPGRRMLCVVVADVTERGSHHMADDCDTLLFVCWVCDTARRWSRGEASVEEIDATSDDGMLSSTTVIASLPHFVTAVSAVDAATLAAYEAARDALGLLTVGDACAAMDDPDCCRAFDAEMAVLADLVREHWPVAPTEGPVLEEWIAGVLVVRAGGYLMADGVIWREPITPERLAELSPRAAVVRDALLERGELSDLEE